MNQRPQPRPAPAQANMARPSNSMPVEIRKLAEELTVVMDALLGTIERETALVRAGKIRDALQLSSEKTGLSRRYMIAVEKMKASQQILSLAAPELLNALRRDHDTF